MITLLNLLEVAPRAAHLPVIVAADGFLASLVRMGVAEAHRLKESLFSASETRAETA